MSLVQNQPGIDGKKTLKNNYSDKQHRPQNNANIYTTIHQCCAKLPGTRDKLHTCEHTLLVDKYLSNQRVFGIIHSTCGHHSHAKAPTTHSRHKLQ